MGEIPEEFLSKDRHANHLKSQNQKLYDLVELFKQETEDLKPLIYEYFGVSKVDTF